MKRLLFSSLALVLLVSCSQNNLLNNPLGDETTENILLDSENLKPRPQDTVFDIRGVRDYVRQEAATYGTNVHIFASYAAFDSAICAVEELDHEGLREWATKHNVQNDIVESNIVYERELDKASKLFNIHPIIPPDTTMQRHSATTSTFPEKMTKEDMATDAFLSTMRNQYPQYLHEYDSLGEHYIEPLGTINEEVFCNEKNLFIIGEELYRFYGKNQLIVCNYRDYNEIAAFNTFEDIEQYIAEQGEGKARIINKSTNKQGLIYAGNREKIEGRYKTYFEFNIGVHKTIWGLHRRYIRINLRNYYKNNRGSWVMKFYHTNLNARIGTAAFQGPEYTFNISHSIIMKNRQCTHIKYTRGGGDVYITGCTISFNTPYLKIENETF